MFRKARRQILLDDRCALANGIDARIAPLALVITSRRRTYCILAEPMNEVTDNTLIDFRLG
jgi:hypothetical protein